MKKILQLFIIWSVTSSTLFAQNIPNADFSDIYIGGIDRLRDWGNSDGCTISEPFALLYYVGLDYSTPDYHIMLRTKTDTSGNVTPSFLFSSSINFSYNAGCNEDFIYVGQPFPHKPDKMLGYYKFRNDSLLTNDFGTCTVILKKFNTTTQVADTVGYGFAQLTPTPTDTVLYPFEVNIQYFLPNLTPDSVVVIFYSTGQQLAGGVLSLDDLSFDFSSSTKDFSPQTHFKVFPNPTSDFIRVSNRAANNKETQVTIYNTNGQTLLEDVFYTEKSISMERFSAGIYFIKLQSADNQEVFKVVKE